MASLSELPDDLLRKQFLLLPTGEDPACLLRVSLTDKKCYRIVADPNFHHLLRQQPPTPWVLGFLNNAKEDSTFASRFIVNYPDPVNLASVRPAARDLPERRVLDSRHSRVLFLMRSPNLNLVVWNPLTNEYRTLVPPPPPQPLTAAPTITNYINAAVLCSADAGACNHRNCHGFRVALVYFNAGVMYVYVYSSETGYWSGPVSANCPGSYGNILRLMPYHPSTLVGDTIYFRCEFGYILAYRLGTNHLSFIKGPPDSVSIPWAVFLMPTKDGRLGCLYIEDDESGLRLRQWSMDKAANGVPQWTKGRAIDVNNLLPVAALRSMQSASTSSYRPTNLQLVGSAEATDVIFLGTWSGGHPDAVYMVEVNSERATKVFDGSAVVVPYTSFRIPVPVSM